jgi:hypothetical protein
MRAARTGSATNAARSGQIALHGGHHDGVDNSVVAMYEPVAQPDGEGQIGQALAHVRRLVEQPAARFTEDLQLPLDRRAHQEVGTIASGIECAQELPGPLRRCHRVMQMLRQSAHRAGCGAMR